MHNLSPLSFKTKGLRIPEASISSHITALVDPGITRSVTDGHKVAVWVIGYDLPNLTNPDYKGWRNLLANWKQSGVKVEYIALDKRERVAGSLQQNQELLELLLAGPGTGTIEICVIKPLEDLENNWRYVAEALRKEYKTSHFLLAIDLTDESRSQMWLEGHHEQGATTATNCFFQSDSDEVLQDPVFIQNRMNFEFLKSISDCVFPAVSEEPSFRLVL